MAKTKKRAGAKVKAKGKAKAKPVAKRKVIAKAKPKARAKPKAAAKPKAKAKPKAAAKPKPKAAAKAKPKAAAKPKPAPKAKSAPPKPKSTAPVATARKTTPAPPPAHEPSTPPAAAPGPPPLPSVSATAPVDIESIETQFEEVSERLGLALAEAAGDEAIEREAMADAVADYGRIRESFGEPPEEYIVHFFGADGVGHTRSRTPALRRPNASSETHQRWVNMLMEAAEAAARMPR